MPCEVYARDFRRGGGFHVAMARPTALVTLLLLLLLAPSAGADDLAGTRAELGRQMGQAGAASGAVVVDLGSSAQLYASRADARRPPASVEKLYTSAAALLRLGPDARLATQLLADPAVAVADDGVLEGDLYLRGAGDPTFGTAQATALARQIVAQTGLARVTGRLVGDETAFDRRRGPGSPGPSAYVGPLSALAYNRGLTGLRSPFFQVSPGLFATQAIERALRREGVAFGAKAGLGRAPADGAPLAALPSPTIADVIGRMNRPSDNFYAETLIKVLGARFGGRGSTSAGARVIRSTLGRLGIAPTVHDGSGLSRTDRTSPQQLVTLLRAMAADPVDGPPFEASLPVAGRTGTLTGRMRGTAAQDRCRAKTGTLSDVSALAGYCDAPGGRKLAFAILMNRVNTFGARRLQDRMAAALARYAP
jgi:serine-type D-Ala-D-Ala carboxypeptidase/endopeptidase (penicillin-binding protein 4)